jgi:hypothetical protein
LVSRLCSAAKELEKAKKGYDSRIPILNKQV